VSSFPSIVVVAGPTAAGKSAIGLRLAEELGGEIVSIDSVQVYQGADIGSAKSSPEERQRVPHHGLDLWEPSHAGDMAQFLSAAREVILGIAARKKTVVCIGGTGLYLTGLLHGLAELPAADDKLRAELESLSNEELVARLSSSDSAAAKRLHPNDRVRLIRAIEGSELTGEPMSVRHARHNYRETLYRAIVVVPLWPRVELYRRIDERTVAMVEGGLLRETRGIIERYGEAAAVLDALGYAEARKVMQGELMESALVPAIAQATRRFAKRQMTYWRNEPLKRGWSVRPRGDECAVELSQGAGGAAGVPFRVSSTDFRTLVSEVREWLVGGAADPGVTVRFVSARELLAP
jgi:tRNA dimethylallyltransferase